MKNNKIGGGNGLVPESRKRKKAEIPEKWRTSVKCPIYNKEKEPAVII